MNIVPATNELMVRGKGALVALALFLSYSHLSAQNVDINAERVSFDMMLWESVHGSMPVSSSSVWPQALPSIQKQLQSSQSEFATWTRDYYSPLLDSADTTMSTTFGEQYGGRFRLARYRDGFTRFAVDVSAMVRAGTYDDGDSSGHYALTRPALRATGSLFDGSLGWFLDLSNGMRLTGSPRLIAGTDPVLGRTFKFIVEEQTFFDRYVGYVQYQHEHFRIRYGREAIQYGPSPIDNFTHSMSAPLMDGLLIDVPYGPVRFTSTHSAADGTDTSGRAIPGKFIATHRLSFDPAPWISASVSDMIAYWGRGLDFSYLNPLAFFVSAGLGTEERSRNDNSMLGFDVTVRPMAGTMLYGSLIIDDLSWSSLSDTSQAGNNNKFAWQLGVSQAFAVSNVKTIITTEYVRVDPFTFSHRSINASYTALGAPVGYDIQPNSDRLAVQLRVWTSARTSLRLDLDYTRNGENLLDADGNIILGEDPRFPGSGAVAPVGNVGGDILRGDGDFLVGNRFLRGNVSHMRRVNLWFSAEPFTNIFTDVRLGYRHRNGGNSPGEFLFTSFEVRIGY